MFSTLASLFLLLVSIESPIFGSALEKCDANSFSRTSKSISWKAYSTRISRTPLLAPGENERKFEHYSELRNRYYYLALLNDSVSTRIITELREFSKSKKTEFQQIFNYSNKSKEQLKKLRGIVEVNLPRILILRKNNRKSIRLIFSAKTPLLERESLWKEVINSKILIAKLLLQTEPRQRWLISVITEEMRSFPFSGDVSVSQAREKGQLPLIREVAQQSLRAGLPLRKIIADRKKLEDLNDQMLAIEDQIIDGNLRWIVRRVMCFSKGSRVRFTDEDLGELMTAGSEGMRYSFTKYDPSHNANFLTYATHWINQKIRAELKFIRQFSTSGVQVKGEIKRIIKKLAHDLGRWPNEFEIAEAAGMTEADFHSYNNSLSQRVTSSLDQDLNQDRAARSGKSITGAALLQAPTNLRSGKANKVLADRLEKALLVLDERSRQILRMRFGISPYEKPHSLKEIGVELGVTRERIRQLVNKSLEKVLKTYSKRNVSFEDIEVTFDDLADYTP